MKRYLYILSMTLATTIVFLFPAKAQDNGGIVSVAILPVSTTTSNGSGYIEIVREKIAGAFTSKSRFTVVDRSRLDAVRKERELQKEAEFLEGLIAEQGVSIGANFLVTSNIIEVSTQNVNTQMTDYFKNPPEKWTRLDLRARLVVAVQIVEVGTGVVRSSRDMVSDYTFTGDRASRPGQHGCLISCANALTGKVKAWINSVFPVEISVIKVLGRDKKGLPEILLITGGAEMDLQNSKTAFSNSSSKLEIYDTEMIPLGDGTEKQRRIPVGSATITRVDGELAECKISNKKEAALVEEKLNQGRTLYLRITSY